MRLVVQEVLHSSVTVEGRLISEIGRGEMVLVGFNVNDNEKIIDKMIAKLLKLRIFPDDQNKTNLDISKINGEILAVSQFTLYADLSEGNRPSFVNAMKPDDARKLFAYFQKKLLSLYPKAKFGIFQADMQVELVNDGPFTVILDSKELGYDGK